jgi:tetratricopeptide (TPR) repeat protein
MNFNIFILATIFISSCFYQKAVAQDVEKLEQEIKFSNIEIYENPDKVIAIGLNIVKKSKNNIDLKIKAYKLVSDGYSSKRDYQKSLDYLTKALYLLPNSNDKSLIILIETKAGILYHQLKIYQNAILYLDRAEEMCLDYPVQDSVQSFLGINYLVRGIIYKEKLNCDIAISFFDKAINLFSLHNKTKDSAARISIAMYNKGNCFLLLGQNELALKSFTEALNKANTINAKSLQAFAKKGIAEIFTLNRDYNNAVTLLNKAYEIAKNVNDLVLNQEIYKGLSENYLALNKQEKYKIYQQKYLSILIKVKENERSSIGNLLNEHNSELEKKYKNDLSNVYSLFFIILSIVISIITFFIVKNLITKTKELNEKIVKINKNFTREA